MNVSKAIVVFREPNLKPLPPSVTPAIVRDAQLPMRLDAAKQAIAACYDLSELLSWKDKAAAIAAAAKAAKMPELAKGANRVCKEALLRLGQLLNEYSNAEVRVKGVKGLRPSAQTRAAENYGINKSLRTVATRFASSPKAARDAVLADEASTASINRIRRRLMKEQGTQRRPALRAARSDSHAAVMGFNTGRGLSQVGVLVKNVSLDDVRACAPDEKKKIREKVADIMELLDAIDEAASK